MYNAFAGSLACRSLAFSPMDILALGFIDDSLLDVRQK